MSNIDEFSYLLKKIELAEFNHDPFPHVQINNFFSEDHFSQIINSKQIKLPEQKSNSELLSKLKGLGYQPVDFPGSITSEEKYLKYIDQGVFDRSNIKGYGREVIEGYGITYRLEEYQDDFIRTLMSFFESQPLISLLRKKFDLINPTAYEGGIQKNLKGYEISPHPDTSRKALTWMANIYTDDDSVAEKEMHTHLCKFKQQYSYIKTFWKDNDVDPVWVPWGWANTIKKTNRNNSITIFKPSFDTLHAVKVSEDHLINQRNQIYGNLWYAKSQKTGSMPWQRLDLLKKPSRAEKVLRKLKLL